MSGRRRTIFFLVMLLAVLVLLTGEVRGEDRRSLGPLGTGVLTALWPLQTVMARVAASLSRSWQLYTEIGRLRVENARLREEVQRLTREVTRLRETAQAARRLETLLAFKLQTPFRVVAARVLETTLFTSRILLLSDPRSAVGVILQHSREIGVVEGNGQGDLQIKYLSRASAVRPGDIVITSGQGGLFPRGIAVGPAE